MAGVYRDRPIYRALPDVSLPWWKVSLIVGGIGGALSFIGALVASDGSWKISFLAAVFVSIALFLFMFGRNPNSRMRRAFIGLSTALISVNLAASLEIRIEFLGQILEFSRLQATGFTLFSSLAVVASAVLAAIEMLRARE